jgi:inorganic pyrophosphatase
MDLKKIGPGKNAPEEVNAIIEIPMNTPSPVKYEYDEENGLLVADRFLATPMLYPFNYGEIPGTLSEDGDPLDVVVVSDVPVIPGCMLTVKPIGVLVTEDEEGKDEKIIAVPGKKLNSIWSGLNSYTELPELTIARIKHFYEHYKDLEKGKWIKVSGYEDAASAKNFIKVAIERANKK